MHLPTGRCHAVPAPFDPTSLVVDSPIQDQLGREARLRRFTIVTDLAVGRGVPVTAAGPGWLCAEGTT